MYSLTLNIMKHAVTLHTDNATTPYWMEAKQGMRRLEPW